jgi:DNA-binding NarL/FixJ family response regulator
MAHSCPATVECELALDNPEAAGEWARRAEAAAEVLDLPSATAHAKRARALVLLACDDPQGAGALAMCAAERLRSIGATMQAARADILAGRALARAGQARRCHRVARAGPCRERQVAELVASGLTNRQIAERFFLSEKTVETHISRILAKLGVASRVAVAGILPPLM